MSDQRGIKSFGKVLRKVLGKNILRGKSLGCDRGDIRVVALNNFRSCVTRGIIRCKKFVFTQLNTSLFDKNNNLLKQPRHSNTLRKFSSSQNWINKLSCF